MHFKQEFKFKLGDRLIYTDQNTGRSEEVTIHCVGLRITKDGQTPYYTCMEGNHRLVSYWQEMEESRLSFAGNAHKPRIIEDDIVDGLGEHLYIGDTVYSGVYYHCNGIRVEDRVPNVDFTFAEKLEVSEFNVSWTEPSPTPETKSGMYDEVGYRHIDVIGKTKFHHLTVGEKPYAAAPGHLYTAWAESTEKTIGENFAEEYVAALDRKGYDLVGRLDAKKAWEKRDETEHTFYVIKQWLTELGKFDEVCKLVAERKSKPKPKPKPTRKAVKKQKDSGIDDLIEKLKSDPKLLAKVKKML